MKSRDGFIAGYNIQIVVDKKNRMIVISVVTNDPFDTESLIMMIEQIKKEYNTYPERLTVDSGYYSPANILKVIKLLKLYIPIPKTKRDMEKVTFSYNSDNDEVICQNGRVLKRIRKRAKKRKRFISVYKAVEDCTDCPIKDLCTKAERRTYSLYTDHMEVEKFKAMMRTPEAVSIIAERKTIAEHPHGTLKIKAGKIPLLLRGKPKVQIEINLYTTSYNLIRLINIEEFSVLIRQINEFCWKLQDFIKTENSIKTDQLRKMEEASWEAA